MNQPTVSMMDLPDEILLTIWNKLNKIDILYSFIGVNKRLDKLVRDVVYTRSIELIKTNSTDDNHSLPELILNRFCLSILPQIHHYIECLTLEPFSMERILNSGNYPKLFKLTLLNFEQEFAWDYFTDTSPFVDIFKKQITHLTVPINDTESTLSLTHLSINFYARIFSLFRNLIDLDFGPISRRQRYPELTIYNLPPKNCFSSSITNLRIGVVTLDDCLCLLDGRLKQLHTFIVRIHYLRASIITSDNTILTSLKCFSFTSYDSTKQYDSKIVPLLRRMSCLEQLILNLIVDDRSSFIDGIHLNNEILIRMPELQTFIFDIFTYTGIINEVNRQSNDDIQRTFLHNIYHHVVSYTDHYLNGKARSHIYSHSSTINNLRNISNGFPEGIFTNIRKVSLVEILRSFEHEFFLRIARVFPLLNHLIVRNRLPQKNKRLYQPDKSEQIPLIVEFSHLVHLELLHQHIDYVEQFLLATNTHLPRLMKLTIKYEHLQIVTENFTRDVTHLNCSKLEHLDFGRLIVHHQEFYQYFPCYK